MIRVVAVDPEPTDELRYLNARSGGGTEVARFPILAAEVEGLPDALDALVLASDLQGVVPVHGHPVPLGVMLAEHLAGWVRDPDRTGVLLGGDLYSVPTADKRGGFGDVTAVWQAFAQHFAWVAGVAGNHDDTSRLERRAPGGVHLLDGSVVALGGLRIGGVGRIVGNPRKPGRRSEDDQLALIELVAEARPDVLVLHEGPPGGERQPGNPDVVASVPLIVCGHVHWRDPLAAHPGGQVLNLEGRAMVLSPRRPG